LDFGFVAAADGGLPYDEMARRVLDRRRGEGGAP